MRDVRQNENNSRFKVNTQDRMRRIGACRRTRKIGWFFAYARSFGSDTLHSRTVPTKLGGLFVAPFLQSP